MSTEDLHARALHPVDGLPLLGAAHTWALDLGSVGASSAFLALGLPVLGAFAVLPGEAPREAGLYLLGLMGSMGILGGAIGAMTGRALCRLLQSRWPVPLPVLRWNLRAAGAAWGGLLSGGSAFLGLLFLNVGGDISVPEEAVLLIGGLMLLLGGGVGAVLVPGLVRAYLQAWLDRFGRRTVLLVMTTTMTGVGMLLPLLAMMLLGLFG